MKAHQAGHYAACATMRLIPRLAGQSDEEILRATIRLQEVQHALALEYGFKSWTTLCRHVESLETASMQEEHMSTDIEARIARLEEEVQQLSKLLHSLSLGPVGNDLVLRVEGQVEALNLSLGNVANNAGITVENGGMVTAINIDMANVGNSVDVTASAPTLTLETGAIGNNLDITTGGGVINLQTGDISGEIHRM